MCRRKAVEWGQHGPRIVSLSPGLIATPQGAESYKHSPGKIKLPEAIPTGRECSMLEIAGVLAFLTSDQASDSTGTDILVDGGIPQRLGRRHRRLPARASFADRAKILRYGSAAREAKLITGLRGPANLS
jgi:NAD(P)-dependent dehydrogenase (short-subunit alcohol dehydrogenase family)